MKPLSESELEAIVSYANDDGWCAWDISDAALQAIFKRVGNMREPTLTQATSVAVEDRCNGALDGISTGKGGRAWLEGEWRLCELEALCAMIRFKCAEEGVTPDGFDNYLS